MSGKDDQDNTVCGDNFRSCRRSIRVYHPRFGDLTDVKSVTMRTGSSAFAPYIEEPFTLFHLTVTGRCYARCLGCINSELTFSDKDRPSFIEEMEAVPERDAALIARLAVAVPHGKITLAFYGGEPFLAAASMARIRRLLDSSEMKGRLRYMVYTNGELLEPSIKLFPEMMKGMWLYSVSIDGDQRQHAAVRPGTDLAVIRDNLRALARVYSGHRVFWSTLREQQSLLNCFETFMDMYTEGLVNQFFWHWADTSEPFAEIQTYADLYGRELQQVMDAYIQWLAEGKLLPVIHINELVLYLLSGKERGATACGVELAQNYDVVAGRVYACADLPPALGEVKYSGDGFTSPDLSSLAKYKAGLGCRECGVHAYCGGRCPVQALSGSPQRTVQICALMRLHVGIVQERIPQIADLLKRRHITLQDIYDRSAKLTRYTDVIP